jgi:hypothetical protein
VLVLLMVSASCSNGDGGFLSRSPEQSGSVEGGPFCGPLEELNDAKLDLIRRSTSNLEIESTASEIRELHEEIGQEAPAEIREEVQLTVRVYEDYLSVLEEEGYGRAPMESITSDEFNEAELALLSYCFQNPGN